MSASEPIYGMGSLYALEPDGRHWWMVQHNDNSDHGRGQHFFTTREGARDYVERLVADPPQGDHFHPAPATLDVRVFKVERVQ